MSSLTRKAELVVEVPVYKLKPGPSSLEDTSELPVAPLSEAEIAEIRALKGLWADEEAIEALLKELAIGWDKWASLLNGSV